MRWTKSFIPTLRSNPAEVESLSQQLLIRAGIIRRPVSSTPSWLPLGQRTLFKIAAIVRRELGAAGAQEIMLPGTGAVAEACAGIARNDIRSYRDLPQIWTVRRFPAAESCSLDFEPEGLERSYRLHYEAFSRIFSRCGLQFLVVEGSPAGTGGTRAEEFMVRTPEGDDSVVSCSCGYAANLEQAASRLPVISDVSSEGPPAEVHTPGQKTIADIAGFLNVPATHQIKSLVYAVDDSPCLFLVRGDHQLNESKAMAASLSGNVRPAEPSEIREVFGADAGSLGPVGVANLPIYADLELRNRKDLTCGANRNDYHLQHVASELHFKPVWADLRLVEEGEACIRCGRPLEVGRAIKIGRLVKLGAAVSGKAGASVLTPEGKQTPIIMGSYSIMLDRLPAAVVESHHDDDGIAWPVSIAPFEVVVTPINYRDQVKEAADQLYADFQTAGIDVLLDDRSERPGVKFKDADLIGVPYRVVVGDKAKQGRVEFFTRATKEKRLVELGAALAIVEEALPRK